MNVGDLTTGKTGRYRAKICLVLREVYSKNGSYLIDVLHAGRIYRAKPSWFIKI